MRVAVTGGAGFIGRATRAALACAGHESWSFDRADGLDVTWAGDLGKLEGSDAVIHLAGVLGTSELFDSAHDAVDVNVHGTLSVLEACEDFGLRYVGISMPDVFPSVYTATKVCADRLATAWHHARGVPTSRVRAFNAYGAGQAHGPGHPRKIVPAFSHDALRNRPIQVWGDGEQTVDLIHVEDLARVLVGALEHGGGDETFDAGTGRAFTVNQVAAYVLSITGSKAGVEHRPMRDGELPTLVRAEGLGWDRLGWAPGWDPAAFAQAVLSYR